MTTYRVIEVESIQKQENLLSPNYYNARNHSNVGLSSSSSGTNPSSFSHTSRVDHYEMFRRMSNSPGRNLSSVGLQTNLLQTPRKSQSYRPRSKSMLTKRAMSLYGTELANRLSPGERTPSNLDIPIVKTSFRSKSMKERSNGVAGHRRSIYVPLVESEQNFLKRAELNSRNKEYRTLVWSSDDTENVVESDNKVGDEINSSQEQLQLYRMRSFKRTSKGIVSQADTIKARSIGSLERLSGSSPPNNHCYDEIEMDTPLKVCSKVRVTCNYDIINKQPVTKLEIQIIGSTFVGKTTMASQFMTSEHICSRMDSVNEDSDKFVSVFIDGLEWNIWLHDTENRTDESNEVNVELLSGIDAYIVVYAIDDASSFIYAKQILGELVEKASRDCVIVLVANKSDLERSREVSLESGKQLAKIHRCLFYEVSTVLNHKIDELLIKTLLKIRQNLKLKEKRHLKLHSNSGGSTSNFDCSGASPLANRRVSSLKLSGKSIKNFFMKKFNGRSCDTNFK